MDKVDIGVGWKRGMGFYGLQVSSVEYFITLYLVLLLRPRAFFCGG